MIGCYDLKAICHSPLVDMGDRGHLQHEVNRFDPHRKESVYRH